MSVTCALGSGNMSNDGSRSMSLMLSGNGTGDSTNISFVDSSGSKERWVSI